MEITMMASKARYKVFEVGHMRPMGLEPCEKLSAGDVGYFTASIKNVVNTQVGDTVTGLERPAAAPLPGYRPAHPMVFSGIYTVEGDKYRTFATRLKS
jgi:GTP-binding protein LepA